MHGAIHLFLLFTSVSLVATSSSFLPPLKEEDSYQQDALSMLNNDAISPSHSHHRKLQSLLKWQVQDSRTKHSQWKSPSNGTDILTDPIQILRCFNQTLCIQPELQLQVSFKVYMCKHINFGVRFYFLIREGLLLHPNVQLVPEINLADLIIYLPGSSDWTKSECGHL